MKCLILLVVLSTICVASARNLPRRHNGMFFYQSEPSYYGQRAAPHRAMFVQYQPGRANRRSTEEGGVSAFAAGNTVAAGTYLKDDCKPAETELADEEQPQGPSVYDDQDAIADAYPEQVPLAQNDEPAGVEDEAAVNDFVPQQESDFGVQGDAPKDRFPEEAADEAPVTPNKNKKKTKVELDDDDDDDETFSPFPSQGKGRPGRRQNGPIPVNTFFPVNFGRTNGGAIAVANSFSTGKGGTATSHATAYGSPSSKSKSKKRDD